MLIVKREKENSSDHSSSDNSSDNSSGNSSDKTSKGSGDDDCEEKPFVNIDSNLN